MNFILDNLIADGKANPRIVVMDTGGGSAAFAGGGRGGRGASAVMGERTGTNAPTMANAGTNHEFKDFDVWAKAGGPLRAYVETVNVEATNGVIKVTFAPKVENPQINAIEIIPQ
jgi:hypothetical protein